MDTIIHLTAEQIKKTLININKLVPVPVDLSKLSKK